MNNPEQRYDGLADILHSTAYFGSYQPFRPLACAGESCAIWPMKPHVCHAPCHSSCHIDITFQTGTAPHAESVPLDGFIYRDLLDHLGNTMVENQPHLISLSWNHRGRFGLMFNGAVPTSLDSPVSIYFGAKYALDRRSESVLIERLSFKNQVVFRHVPAQGTNTKNLFRDLQLDPMWSDVTFAQPLNLYILKNSSKYGMFFIEFHDNSTSRTFKHVTSTPIYLNGELCHAVKAIDPKPPVPQCTVCLRWGHRAHLCCSMMKRCWKCRGVHDKHDHAKTCGPCEKAGNTTGTCPCEPFCINCQGHHRADVKDCSFYAHHRDGRPRVDPGAYCTAPPLPGVDPSTWVPTQEGKKGKGKKVRGKEAVGADDMET